MLRSAGPISYIFLIKSGLTNRTVQILLESLQLSQFSTTKAKVALHLSILAGRKELILAGLNGKVQGARVHFSRHNSPNSRALADLSGRTERL